MDHLLDQLNWGAHFFELCEVVCADLLKALEHGIFFALTFLIKFISWLWLFRLIG